MDYEQAIWQELGGQALLWTTKNIVVAAVSDRLTHQYDVYRQTTHLGSVRSEVNFVLKFFPPTFT